MFGGAGLLEAYRLGKFAVIWVVRKLGITGAGEIYRELKRPPLRVKIRRSWRDRHCEVEMTPN